MDQQKCDELWAKATQNTELRTRAMELSRAYSYILRAMREVGNLESETEKGPQAALAAMAECLPAFSKRRDELDAWVIRAEREYDELMAKLDYETVR